MGAEYKCVYGDPAAVHGMCEDYRAASTIDMTHDAADIDKKVTSPLLTLWADPGTMGSLYKATQTRFLRNFSRSSRAEL